MTKETLSRNRVKAFRQQRDWSQAELAARAGISRTAVSAIEGLRLTPSVAIALSLARTFGCTVEELFVDAAQGSEAPEWAFPPPTWPWRYWQAEVGGRVRLFPVERAGVSFLPDGTCAEQADASSVHAIAAQTLVLASCDPASGILATTYHQRTGLRLLVLTRSSQRALELLQRGIVHVAGVHFATADQADANQRAVADSLGPGYCLARVATWEEGIALQRGNRASSIRSLMKSRARWVAREVGSGARKCLDGLLPGGHRFRCVATDHRGVAEAISAGWADAGICVRLVSEESGLRFLLVQREGYDLCFPRSLEHDPRLQGLVSTLRSSAYRKHIGDLPGYDASETGELSFL